MTPSEGPSRKPVLHKLENFDKFGGIERLYVGSYFCDRFFLAISDAFFAGLAAFCEAHDMRATLVLPIFSQRTLDRGIERAEAVLASYASVFDEVTVNDAGMAHRARQWCARFGLRCNAGRLLARDPRDPRYWQTSAGVRACRTDSHEVDTLIGCEALGLVELDPFAPVISARSLEGLPFALHLPHCFMSTGHICEASSTERPVERCYRPNAPCAHECLEAYTLTSAEGWETMPSVYFVKMGRTVYFENPGCEVVDATPARVVWTPNDFTAGSELTWM